MSVTEFHVPGAHGKATHLRAGQFLTVLDLQGSQVVDFVAFAGPGNDEFLSVTHAQVHLKRFLVGLGDDLVTNYRRPILKIVHDDTGRHDMHYAMCDPERYRLYFDVTTPHRSCLQNFTEAFAAEGREVPRGQMPNPINLNQNVATNERGELELLPSLSKPGNRIVIEALAECYPAVSACPMDIGPINGGSSTDILIRVSDTLEEALA